MNQKEIWIDTILQSKKIKNYIYINCKKQGRIDLQEDLLFFCIEQILEKNDDQLLQKLNGKSIENYFIGIIMNQINSDNCIFYKQYRNSGFTKISSIGSIDDIDLEYELTDIQNLIQKDNDLQVQLDIINNILRFCNPLNVEVFKLKYINDMSFEEISDYYKINIRSVRYRCNNVKNQIKKMLIPKDNNNGEI